MKALLALFSKGPFKPLQAHAEKARACVERLTPLFATITSGDEKARTKLVEEICQLESEADEIKNDLRSHLPKSMFLPVDRRDVLEILTLQDSIADDCQDIAVTLTLRAMELHAALRKPLDDLLKEVTRTCVHAVDVMREIDELVETSFGGKEADKVLGMLDELNSDETIADGVGITLSRQLFALEDEVKPVDTMIWYQLFRQLGGLADLAESIGNRVRLLLAR